MALQSDFALLKNSLPDSVGHLSLRVHVLVHPEKKGKTVSRYTDIALLKIED